MATFWTIYFIEVVWKFYPLAVELWRGFIVKFLCDVTFIGFNII